MPLTEEIWKETYFSDNHLVSNKGRIKRKSQTGEELILKGCIVSHGYLGVNTYIKKLKKQKTFTVHRTVAFAFVPNPENKPHINHKDGNKLNNEATNLEWCTRYENMIHARDNNLLHPPKGEAHCRAKLTTKDVLDIRASKLKDKQLSIKYGVNIFHIYNIKSRRKWKHV